MDSVDAFEVLVRENARMLTAFIRASLSDETAVDDIWQETMLTAWRRWDDYDRRRPFGAWLRGIAGKNILAWRRRNAGQPMTCDEQTLEHFDEIFAKMHQLTGDTFDEKLQAVRTCIESLSDSYREVIRLRYEEELMPASVAERQAVKLETVKKQLQRAKSLLLECLNRKLDLAAASS